MKRKFKIVLCSLFGLGVLVASCKKDEENSKPETTTQATVVDSTSLISKNWKIQDYLVNGESVDSAFLSEMANFSVEFTKDGKEIDRNNDTIIGQGTWRFINGKTAIVCTSENSTDTLNIKKLNAAELWILTTTTISVESGDDFVEKVVPAEMRMKVK